MKVFLASLFLIPCICSAQVVQNYNIEILDQNNQLLHKSEFSYPSKINSLKSQVDIPYVELCLKNDNKVEFTQKKALSTLLIDTKGRIGDEDALNLNVNTPFLKNINIGDCEIQTPIQQKLYINLALPFFLFEQKYPILDEKGQDTNQEVIVKIETIKK